MKELKINAEFKNIDELKKLLQSALSQIEQLEVTLEKISEFKIKSAVKLKPNSSDTVFLDNTVKNKTLFIDEGTQGENFKNLSTIEIKDLLKEKIDDDITSIIIKKAPHSEWWL